MGCGCNKNKTEISPEVAPQQLKNILTTKLGMVASFAKAVASRGVTNKKIELPVKQLRVLSCFGNDSQGGSISPCEHLKSSQTPGKHYCGGCGCGDKPRTWLIGNSNEYSKLDYPALNCPLKMPGFTNYEATTPEEQVNGNTRKHLIEMADYKEIDKVQTTTNEPPATLQ